MLAPVDMIEELPEIVLRAVEAIVDGVALDDVDIDEPLCPETEVTSAKQRSKAFIMNEVSAILQNKKRAWKT